MGLVGGLGAKMLMKMGWSEGTGLGAKRDGIVAPIVARKREQNVGIGARNSPFVNCWWDKMMENAYGKSEEAGDDAAVFEAAGGVRCKAHGTGKLARLRAHEMAAKGVKEEKVEVGGQEVPQLEKHEETYKRVKEELEIETKEVEVHPTAARCVKREKEVVPQSMDGFRIDDEKRIDIKEDHERASVKEEVKDSKLNRKKRRKSKRSADETGVAERGVEKKRKKKKRKERSKK